MPLKHRTETILVCILAAVCAFTGVVIALLPSLSQSIIPWMVAFVLAVAYPVALYPIFKSRRADYPFRLLHLIPALMLLLWLAFDLLGASVTQGRGLKDLYTWGWGLSALIPAFILLALFAISVLRQRNGRLLFLGVLLGMVVLIGSVGEHYRWNEIIAGTIWPMVGIPNPIQVASEPSPYNTTVSDDPAENLWRTQLRRMERRNRRLAQNSQSPNLPTSLASSSSSAPAVIAKTPPRLSSSGPEEVGVMMIVMLAGYTGIVHQRAVRRRVIT